MAMHGDEVKTQPDQITAASAVERAQKMLKIENDLGKVSDSLFDTIVTNEIGPATSLATRMLGDYRLATQVVHAAFENARTEFSAYDGSESPRSWFLGYVADEAVRRSETSERPATAADCHELEQPDAESALNCLAPERRLAVVLMDVLGMTEEAAARISKVDLNTVRYRAANARAWIAQHLKMPKSPTTSTDGAIS